MKALVEVGIDSPYARVKLEVDLPDDIDVEDDDAVQEYIESIEDELRDQAYDKAEHYIDSLTSSHQDNDVDISFYQIYKDLGEFGEVEFIEVIEED